MQAWTFVPQSQMKIYLFLGKSSSFSIFTLKNYGCCSSRWLLPYYIVVRKVVLQGDLTCLAFKLIKRKKYFKAAYLSFQVQFFVIRRVIEQEHLNIKIIEQHRDEIIKKHWTVKCNHINQNVCKNSTSSYYWKPLPRASEVAADRRENDVVLFRGTRSSLFAVLPSRRK